MKHLSTGLALLALTLPPVAVAGIGAGDLEAGVNISMTSTEITVDTGIGETTTTSDFGSLGGAVGYFVNDWFEAKGAVSMTITDDANFGILSLGGDAVFMQETMAPFVGAAYGLAFGDSLGVDSDYLDVHGGLKFFIHERASLEFKLNRFEPLDSESTAARTELTAGINVYF